MATRAEPPADRVVSSPYEVLGVPTGASSQQIEAAYRRAALESRYQDGSWRELRDAYDVLRDPDQRARHDLGLDGGLEYPHYTRPPDFRGWRVPEILLSGDHAKIEEWRREQSRRRPVT